jgi:hypothetical protein
MMTTVSFETAKLLKEKGYNFYHRMSYWKSELTDHTPGYALEDGITSQDNYFNFERYYAPTIAEVIMWLYEKNGIWIWVERCSTLFRPYAEEIGDERFGKWEGHKFSSPTEAYEESIKYTLNNLI